MFNMSKKQQKCVSTWAHDKKRSGSDGWQSMHEIRSEWAEMTEAFEFERQDI